MTSQAKSPESALQWRRPPVTVAELIEALSDCDAAMPVVVDGYEGGYDSLTADNIAVIAIDPDVAKPEFRSWMGDHERPCGCPVNARDEVEQVSVGATEPEPA